ncbi:MAG: oligosaccharide flippase family protein [Acidimicrobiales bacterium]
MTSADGSAPQSDQSHELAAGVTLRRLVIRGSAYLTAREGLGALIRLAGVILVVRLVGPSAFGVYSGAAIFVSLGALLAQGGAEVFIIRQQSEPSMEMYGTVFTCLAISSVVVAGTAFGLSFLVGGLVHSNRSIEVFRVLIFSIPVNVLWAPAQARIERSFDYRKMGIIEVGGDIVLYAVSAPLAAEHFGAWSLVAGFFAWQVWLFSSSLFMSGLRLRFRWSMPIAKTLLGHGTSFAAAGWVSGIGSLSIPIVVGIYRGAVGIGYVAFALRLVDTVAFARRGTWRLGLVSMSKVGDDVARLRSGLEDGALLQVLALGVPLALVSANARWIIPTIFGQSWAPTVDIFALLGVAALLRSPEMVQSTLLYARGRNISNLIATVIRQGCLVVAAVFLVRPLGIAGYGLAAVLSVASIVYTQAVVRRKVVDFSYRKMSPFLLALCPVILSSLLPLPWCLSMLAPMLIVGSFAAPRVTLRRIFGQVGSALVRLPRVRDEGS